MKEDKLYAEQMKKIAKSYGYDTEVAHTEADDLLIKILVTRGFTETAEAWHSLKKWYA